MQAEQIERGDGGAPLHLDAAGTDLLRGVADAALRGDGDVDRSGRLALLRVGAGDAGDADANVHAELAAHGLRHGARRLDADDAGLAYCLDRHSPALLQLGRVGDEAAAEGVGAAGHVGQHTGEQTTRAGLHRAEGQAAVDQHLQRDALRRVAVHTENVLSEPFARSRVRLLDQCPRLIGGGGLRGEADVHGVALGVGRDGGVVSADKVAEALLDGGFAHAGDAENAREEDRAGTRPQVRKDLVLPHARHLGGYAGHGHHDFAVPLGPPAWRRSDGIG